MTKLSYVIPTSPSKMESTQKQPQQFYATSSPRRQNVEPLYQHGYYYSSPRHAPQHRTVHAHSLSDGYEILNGAHPQLLDPYHEDSIVGLFSEQKPEYHHFQIRSPSAKSTPTKAPQKLTVGSPKQDPIGSPLQSPKGIQSTLNTPSTRRALSFHDDFDHITTLASEHLDIGQGTLYSHFTLGTSEQPNGTNNPSPWTKSGVTNSLPQLEDELSPTQPQPFSVFYSFPSVIQGEEEIPNQEHVSTGSVGASNSLFSDSPPFLKKQQSVSFAPEVQQQQQQYNHEGYVYPIAQSYPRPQYGINHLQQQQQYPSSYPTYPHPSQQAPSYDTSQQQYQNWFDGITYHQQLPHIMPQSYQQQQQPQQVQPFSPPRNSSSSFKNLKSKSYPSSPNRSPSQAKRQSNRGYNGNYGQNGYVTHQHGSQHHHSSGSGSLTTSSNSTVHHTTAPQQIGTDTAGEGNRCRGMYKEFAKDVKDMEKNGYRATRDYVLKNLHSAPYAVHWRIYMDLADLAKRENMITEARKWFKKVNDLQPGASQGWLEHAKLEEECGRLEHCERLLLLGLEHCPQNESLLVKAIKHFEQVQNPSQARALLARLRNMSLEKSWKIMLEGALLESRLGNVSVARKVFKYLMQHVSRHGPIYYEAYRLEEKCEEWEQALEIVERGLEANPRYGPLWFAAFHLYEKRAYLQVKSKDQKVDLEPIRECLQRAVQNISKELIWKVYFEQAQIEERAGNVDLSRKSYCRSVVASMPNLRWKVWLAGSRTELNQNNISTARTLLNRALEEVPVKTRAVVLIECARLEEYTGDLKKARQFLKRAQHEAKHEWKVFLESILLEMRAGEYERAIEEAKKALKIHRGTGRLWAVLIQLKGCLEGPGAQLKVFREALDEVPKSGEVWCEGARIRLNPLTNKFNLEKARRYLDFAIKFTPQYGDSFIEYLRLELLTRGPYDDASLHNPQASADGRPFDNNHYDIEQLCVNADPNYGPLWFHCKENVLDSTRQVLRRAKKFLMAELLDYRDLYQQAIMSCNIQSSNGSTVVVNNNTYLCRDFITGLYELNMTYSNAQVTDMALRKKYIYGSEICV